MNLFVRKWAAHEVPFPKAETNLSDSSDFGGFDQTVELIWKNGQVYKRILYPPTTVLPEKTVMPDLINNHEKQTDKILQDDTPNFMGKVLSDVAGVWEEPLHEQHPPEPALIEISVPTPSASFTGKHPGGEEKSAAEPEPEPEPDTLEISIPTYGIYPPNIN